MKIVRILGGLGNQMFQYALYLSLKHHFPEEVVLIDASLMGSYKVHNGLEIDRVFGVELPQASFRQLCRLTIPVRNYKLSRVIEKFLPSRSTVLQDISSPDLKEKIFSAGDRYYCGYWLDYRYCLDTLPLIRRTYKFRLPLNPRTLGLLEILAADRNSVSIHVRRGDYLKVSNYAGLCGPDYYTEAIRYIRSKVESPEFYVFSDDMEWCRSNLPELLSGSPTTFVDWNHGADSPADMMLISKCHHNIIANSSFSWWGAVLNGHEDKIVCAPAEWTNNKSYCQFQMPDWVLF